jgi:pectin methylesterase-like acyl-CoA thioesterase
MKKLFTLVFLCLGMSWLHQASAQYQLVVAADGSGHYTTINEAMSAAVAALEGGFEGRALFL